MNSKIKKIFFTYIIILSVILLFKFHISVNYIIEKINSIKTDRDLGIWNINLIPFKTISSQLKMFKHIPLIAMKNLAGNIILLIPFGTLLPLGWEHMKKYYKTLMVSIGYVLIIEFIQFSCMLGSFDIDDIMLNIIGVSCGYMLFYFHDKKSNFKRLSSITNRK